jgi:hypothetical protein
MRGTVARVRENGRLLLFLVLVAGALFFGSILFIISRAH